jgi:hypothetical protein
MRKIRSTIFLAVTGKVRFLDGGTLALAPEELPLPTWAWKSWLVYDRYLHQTYVLTTRMRSGWVEEKAGHTSWPERLPRPPSPSTPSTTAA